MRSASVRPLLAVAVAAGALSVLLALPAQATHAITFRASISVTGGDPEEESSRALLSADGRYAVFHSGARNLVPVDPHGPGLDVFWRDTVAGVTRMVSLAPDGSSPDGDSTFPAVSGDGCFVVFQSAASNLVAGDNPGADVFRRDICAPGIQFEKVSVPTSGLNGNGFSTRPTISGDGRWVAFNSTAQLIPEDVDAATDAYLRDMSKTKGQAGWLIRMSRTIDEANDPDEDSIRAIVSENGEYVVFASAANLDPADTNGRADIYRFQIPSGPIELASRTASGGLLTLDAQRPWISGNGRLVTFQTVAPAVTGDSNGNHDVYVRDMVAGTTRRVSLEWDGAQPAGGSTRATINRDGCWIAFAANGPLTRDDKNGRRDVYLRNMCDTSKVNIQRVSVRTDHGEGACVDTTLPPAGYTTQARPGAANISTRPSISADGQVVLYVSGFCRLVDNDNNNADDIFIGCLRTNCSVALPPPPTSPPPTGGAGGTGGGGGGGRQRPDRVLGEQVGAGYWLAASDGGMFAFGSAAFLGSTGGTPLNSPIVGMAAAPSGNGYWLAAADGGMFAFGDAGFFGSTGGTKLNSPIVATAAVPRGGGSGGESGGVPPTEGYWLAAADGGMFAFGDAGFFGSTGGTKLNSPIVAVAPTPSGQGYWLAAADGGMFAFGDAGFFGSTGGTKLNSPIVAMAGTPSGQGYWLAAADGGMFAFGDAGFLGSTGATLLNSPIVAMDATPSGNGYWLAAADGGMFAFGDAEFVGSTGGEKLNRPIVSMAAR